MVEHVSITDPNIHEPKGAAAASAGQVYKADGQGSGEFTSNINKFLVSAVIEDISTASSVFVSVPFSCTLNNIKSVLSGAIATSDAAITFTKNGSDSMGSGITVTQSGSAEGDVDTFDPTSNNTLVANDYVKITTDGASTNTVPLYLTLTFEIV